MKHTKTHKPAFAKRRKHAKVHKPIVSTKNVVEKKKPQDGLSKSQKRKLKAKANINNSSSPSVPSNVSVTKNMVTDSTTNKPVQPSTQSNSKIMTKVPEPMKADKTLETKIGNKSPQQNNTTTPNKVVQHTQMSKNTEDKTENKPPKQSNLKTPNVRQQPLKSVKKPTAKEEKIAEAHEKKTNKPNGPTQSKDGVDNGSKMEKVIAKKRMKKLKWKQKQMQLKLERKQQNVSEKSKNKKVKVNTNHDDKKTVKENGVQNDLSKAKKKKEKKNKVKHIDSKVLGAKSEIVKKEPPVEQEAEEVSCNWKKLQEELAATQKKAVKRKHTGTQKNHEKQRKVDPPAKTEEPESSEPEIWFDDVDEILLDRKIPLAPMPASRPDKPALTNPEDSDSEPTSETTPSTNVRNPLVKDDAFKGVTKIVAMDCEMVGVGDGTESMLARVSIVNQYGEPVYDKFVKPRETVVDYRTHVSGVRPQDLVNAEKFEDVQKEVADILKGKLLVGHAIMNDLKVLFLSHPRRRIRDTSRYKKFRQVFGGRTPSLKKLSEKLLAVAVQEGEHNSIQDAQAAMRLYTMYRKQWEGEMRGRKFGGGSGKST